MKVKLEFDEVVELIIGRHKTNLGGTSIWVDWDAVYSDLLDEGYEPSEASILLDDYIDSRGY